MIFLPIVGRELRVAARRRNTYWIRVVLAAVALIIGGWVMLFERMGTPQNMGQIIFTALSAFVFFYCALAGLRATSDCLSEEKREGTLGLLFLTDLKGYDIVLGKLAATSLDALCGLLAVLPVMAIPLLLGSVTAGEVARVALVALNTLFLSLAVGMFASAVSREERRAMGLCFCILAGLTVGLPLIGMLIADRLNWNEPPDVFLVPSPGFSCFLAFEGLFKNSRNQTTFLESVALVHAMGWTFLVLSCLIVPRAWQEKTTGPRRSRWREGWQGLFRGSPEGQRRFRTRLLATNPFYWLAARDRSRVALVWLFLIVSSLLWLWGWRAYPRSWLDEPTYIFTGLALNTVFKCWVAGEAGWRFSVDRNSGALELVLATPLRIKEIVGGQLAALVRQFGLPLMVVVGVEFVFLRTASSEREWIVVWTAGIIMLVADWITLSWVGMWLGLNSRHHSRAMGAALALVCVLPWLLLAMFATAYGLAQLYRYWDWDETGFTLVWLAIGLVIDGVLVIAARHFLRERFRSVVTERFVPQKGRS
jgi:ABC-type transport system involved in multi-copper enzyme maturation permease subunit